MYKEVHGGSAAGGDAAMSQEPVGAANSAGGQGKAASEVAVFAAGCFWGVQYYFDQVPGLLETEAGYTGGTTKDPTYEQVCFTDTGHAEAVKITFDPKKVSYETLLGHFFRIHDPTQLNRQGADIGRQYRSAIFYTSDKQKKTAKTIIDRINQEKHGGKVVTALEKAGEFYTAEEYHQKFTERTGRGACHVDYAPL